MHGQSCLHVLGVQRLVLLLPSYARLWASRGSVRSSACSATFSFVLPSAGFSNPEKKSSSSIRR
jgi:hypothetical protein